MELNGAPASIDQVRVLALTNYGHFTSMLVQDREKPGFQVFQQFPRRRGGILPSRDAWEFREKEIG